MIIGTFLALDTCLILGCFSHHSFCWKKYFANGFMWFGGAQGHFSKTLYCFLRAVSVLKFSSLSLRFQFPSLATEWHWPWLEARGVATAGVVTCVARSPPSLFSGREHVLSSQLRSRRQVDAPLVRNGPPVDQVEEVCLLRAAVMELTWERNSLRSQSTTHPTLWPWCRSSREGLQE